MRVLVACEFSGVVRDAFLDRGHDAWSCDLMPALYRPSRGRHIVGDVRPLLRERWDLVIAHPPCTYLANSGVRWLDERPGRRDLMRKGAELFNLCLDANAPRVCVENPIQHGEAVALIREPFTQVVHPWEFGSTESKATRLWLKGLPDLVPTDVRKPTKQSSFRMAPGPHRGRMRSITCRGIAEAMADQWGLL